MLFVGISSAIIAGSILPSSAFVIGSVAEIFGPDNTPEEIAQLIKILVMIVLILLVLLWLGGYM